MNGENQTDNLDIATRMKINAAVESFRIDASMETAQDIFDSLPLGKKRSPWGVSLSFPSLPMIGLTDQGLFRDKEAGRTTINTGSERYLRCGGYKIEKTKTKVVIFKFNDIDEKGWHLSEFGHGDPEAIVINYRRGKPVDWGYSIVMQCSLEILSISFAFIDRYYSMEKLFVKRNFYFARKFKMFLSIFI